MPLGPDHASERGGAWWRASPLLRPLSQAYVAGLAIDRRRRLRAAPPPGHPRVVSVGNLEVGGNGKTPLAMYLLERASVEGRAVACVSRGYRSRSARGPLVSWVPALGDEGGARPGLRMVMRDHPRIEDEIGDEGAEMALRVPSASLYFSRDKARAVRAAADGGAALVVLDDGFQSWAVPRHVDVVMLDALRPLANGRVLPAGPLREPPSALARAHVVVFNGARDSADVMRARETVQRWLRPGARVAGLVRRTELVVPGGAGAGAPSGPVLAVSGVARPDGFARSLAGAGVAPAAHEVFPDHHRYGRGDAERIAARARELGAAAVVTTGKDWVKLRRFDLGAPVWVARLETTLIGDDIPW